MTDQPGWAPPPRPPFEQGQQQPYGGAPWGQTGQQPYAGQPSQSGAPQHAMPQNVGGPPDRRAKPPKKRHRKLNAILITITGLIVVIVIITALGGSKSKTAATAAPPIPTPSVVATTPAPTPAATTPSLAQQMTTWDDTDGGGAAMQAITTELGDLQSDAEAGNLSALGSDCAQLATDVSNLQAVGTLPYAPAARPLTRALSLYSQSAALCQAGANQDDAADIEQATTDLNRANVFLGRAVNRIKKLNGD